jgi:hypothetical protein
LNLAQISAMGRPLDLHLDHGEQVILALEIVPAFSFGHGNLGLGEVETVS